METKYALELINQNKDREITFSQIVDKLDENINCAIPNWYFHFLSA